MTVTGQPKDKMALVPPARRIPLLVAAAFAIALGLIGYGYQVGDLIYSVQSPMLSTADEIENEAFRLRVWMEQIVDGHLEYNGELPFEHLHNAIEYLATLDRTRRAALVDPEASPLPEIGTRIETLRSLITACKSILSRFAAQQPRHGQPANLLEEISRTFYDFSTTVNEIESAITTTIEKSRTRFRAIQALLISLLIALAVAAMIASKHYDRQRRDSYLQLSLSSSALENELERRKAAEAELAERELLIRAIYDNSPVAIVVTRLSDNSIVDVNAAFETVSGYSKGEVVGRNFLEIAVWANPADRETTLQRLAISRRVHDLEFQFRMRSGEIREFALSANVIDLSGKAHIIATARDVTEVRRFEKALRESDERLLAVMDHLPIGVWFTDEQGKIIYGNPAGRRIWEGAQYVGPEQFHEYKAWWADTGIALTADDWAVARVIRHGQSYLNEVLDIEAFDGTHKTILHSAVPMRDPSGRIIGVVVLNEEITERKKTEARITWLATFPLLDPNPIIEVDLTGQLYYRNPTAEELLPDPVQAQAVQELLADWEAAADQFRTDKVHTIVREIEFQGRWFHQTLNWIKESQRVRIYGLDITERKQAELTLKTSHDTLEVWVNERTLQLRTANLRLQSEVEERLKAERLLITHQGRLRTLSSALVQTEERERRRISTALHDGIGQTLAAAKIRLGSLRAMITADDLGRQMEEVDDILAEAIRETRALTIELSLPVLYEIGLRPALEWLAEQFKRKFGLRIVLESDGHEEMLEIPERVFLYQAIRELCFNAVKHAQATQVTISVHTDGKTQGTQCTVADNGRGFDPTIQTDTARNDQGFGLFSIREQLRQYNGFFELQSQPGAGTQVTLKLPAKAIARLQGATIDEG